jgi:hypothetical protein
LVLARDYKVGYSRNTVLHGVPRFASGAVFSRVTRAVTEAKQ